jgi:hypothetical protein
MNYQLESMAMGPRGSGRTTALAAAAKSIGATLVCNDFYSSKWIAKEHGVKTISRQELSGGSTGPFIWDHHALEQRELELEVERSGLVAHEALEAYGCKTLVPAGWEVAVLQGGKSPDGDGWMLIQWKLVAVPPDRAPVVVCKADVVSWFLWARPPQEPKP